MAEGTPDPTSPLQRAREVAETQQDWQVDEETVARRREQGHRALAAHLDTGAVLDALPDAAIRAYAADLDADGAGASGDS